MWRVYSHRRNKAKSSLVFVWRKFTTTTNSTFVCYCIFCLKPNSIEGKDKGKFKLISLIQQQIFSFVSLLFTPIARIKKSCGSVLISQLQFGHLHSCNQVCMAKNTALQCSERCIPMCFPIIPVLGNWKHIRYIYRYQRGLYENIVLLNTTSNYIKLAPVATE